MRFSVVTVCYNAEIEIEKTILSVLEQENTDYDYVFIDGNSSDATNEIINSHKESFAQKKINVKHISEEDSGIYDAMNKGIDNAFGEWIIFMNAGDSFYSNQVLKKVSNLIDSNSHADIIYGNTCVSDGKLFQIRKAEDEGELSKGMPFFHQSVFVRNTLLKNTKFDTSYRICADYNMFIGFKKYNKRFVYIDEIISFFLIGGISGQQKCKAIEESFRIKDSYAEYYSAKEQSKEINKIKLKEKIRKFIPNWIIYCKNRYLLGWKPLK